MLTRSSSESATTRSNGRQVNDPETWALAGRALAGNSGGAACSSLTVQQAGRSPRRGIGHLRHRTAQRSELLAESPGAVAATGARPGRDHLAGRAGFAVSVLVGRGGLRSCASVVVERRGSWSNVGTEITVSTIFRTRVGEDAFAGSDWGGLAATRLH